MESLFLALGHEDRLQILELLLERERTQKELGDEIGTRPGTVSKWMKELTEQGLVARDGYFGSYRIVRRELLLAVLVAGAELKRDIARNSHQESTDRGERLRALRSPETAGDSKAKVLRLPRK